MAGDIKHAIDKVTDMVGGTVGKIGAAMTVGSNGFIDSAATGDMYEIKASRLALLRSRRDDVRQFARMMIADHTTSTHHLQAALEMNETRGVGEPPQQLDARRGTMLQHLEEAPDDAFDETYLDQQVLAHQETLSLMSAYRDGGDNAQLRSLAMATAPVVERHLRMVEALRAAA